MKIYEVNCTVHGMIVWIKCVIKMSVLQSITFQILKQTSTIMMTNWISNFIMLYQCFTFEKPRRTINRSPEFKMIWGSDFYFFFIHQVAFYVIRVVALLRNRVMQLVLQSDLFGCAVTYLASHKHLDRVCTSKHITYYVSHLVSIMNVFSRFMRPAPGML